MLCEHCGKALPPEAAFCPYCGERIAAVGEPRDSMPSGSGRNNQHASKDKTVEAKGTPPSNLADLHALVLDTDGMGDTFIPAAQAESLAAPTPAPVRGVYKPSLVVSATGDGDYCTIGEALDHAEPDACISVRPGRYTEALVITKPVEIVAEGNPGDVMLESVGEHTVLLWADRAALRGLTLRASSSGGETPSVVNIPQGRLECEGCDLSAEGLVCIAVHGNGAEASLLRCTVHDAASGVFVYDGGCATLEECDLFGNALAAIGVSRGGKVELMRCRLHDNRSVALHFQNAGGTVTMCEFRGNSDVSIAITGGASSPVLRKCTIHDGGAQGILISDSASPTVEDCEVYANASGGIAIRAEAAPLIRACVIRDNPHAGIQVLEGSKGTIEDCDISRNKLAGIALSEAADPEISRCRIHHGKASGVYIFGEARGTFADCDIFENSLEGIRVCEQSNPSVRNCRIRRAASDGILVYTGGNGLFENCLITDNARAGVSIREKGNPVLRRCTIQGNRHEAIHMYESAAAIVDGCELTNNARSSWNVSPDCRVERTGNAED